MTLSDMTNFVPPSPILILNKFVQVCCELEVRKLSMNGLKFNKKRKFVKSCLMRFN